jgi:hypothetical protein
VLVFSYKEACKMQLKILKTSKCKVMSYIIKRRIKLSHENLPLKLSNIEHVMIKKFAV